MGKGVSWVRGGESHVGLGQTSRDSIQKCLSSVCRALLGWMDWTGRMASLA